MTKNDILDHINIEAVYSNFLNINYKCNTDSDVEILMIMCGEKHFNFGVISLLIFFNKTDISKYKINILYESGFYDEEILNKMKSMNINVVLFEESGCSKINTSNGLCKYDYLLTGKINNNVFILDSDTFVNSDFCFSLDKFPKDKFIFASVDPKNEVKPIFPLLNRYVWIKNSYPDLTLEELLIKTYKFFETKTSMSYDEFKQAIFDKPIIPWPNCGVGFIPKSILNDNNFIEWGNYCKEEIKTTSDEFLYFFYALLNNLDLDTFEEYKFHVTVNPCENVYGIYHVFSNSNNSMYQKIISSLINIAPNDTFTLIKNKQHEETFEFEKNFEFCSLNNNFSYLNKNSLNSFCVNDDMFFRGLNHKRELILESHILKDINGYYNIIIDKVRNKEFRIDLFKECPEIFCFEYVPEVSNYNLDKINLKLFDPNGDFFYEDCLSLID